MSSTWKVITCLTLILAICYKIIEKPPIPETIDEFNTEYKAFDIKSPCFYGTTLKIFRIIMELPIIGTFIVRLLYRINKFHVVRDFGYNLNVMPIYVPRRLLYDNEYNQHLEMSKQNNYKSILNTDLTNIENILGKNINPSQLITVESIIKSYQSGNKTPMDIIKQSLQAANKLSHLNIFIQLNKNDIIKQAQESTQRWQNNKPLSILDGIPIAVKDEYDVIGYNTTYGSSFLGEINGICEQDHVVVARIRRMGAIIFGKTNMHEIGLFPSGINGNHGSARNPYSFNLIHDTGGSSSGSGVAVSTGIVPLALGADGGGSIRIPSSLNGIIGLKATYSRIPFLPHGSAWSVLHNGFLSNTVRDQAIGYMSIANYEKDNSFDGNGDTIMNPYISATTPPLHLFEFDKIDSLKDLNIGVYWEWLMDSQKEVRDECIKVIDILKNKYNANIINFTIPHLDIISKSHSIVILSEWVEGEYKIINREKIKGKIRSYQDATEVTMFVAKQFDVVDLLSAMKIRNWLLKYFNQQIFNKNGEKYIDVFITPTTPIVSPQYVMESLSSSISDMETVEKLVKYAFLGNFIGIPGIQIPIGYSQNDGSGEKQNGNVFPIGMQIYANHWNEHKLFRIANLIEQNIVNRQLPPNKNMYQYDL
eukprot:246761_1